MLYALGDLEAGLTLGFPGMLIGSGLSEGTPPVFIVQPTSQTTTSGGSVTFGPVSVTGTPAPTLQWWKSDIVNTYFEAPPYAGTVGSPVTSDPNWQAQGASPSQVKFYGDYMILENRLATGGNFIETVQKGDVTSASCEYQFSNNTANDDCYVQIISDGSADNRFGFYWDSGAFVGTKGDIRIYWASGSGYTQSDVIGNIGTTSDIESATLSITVLGVDISYDFTFKAVNETAVNFTGTINGSYNTSVKYGIACNTARWDTLVSNCRIDGVGFGTIVNGAYSPIAGETGTSLTRNNIGTTGDTFGTKYKCVATNTAGSTDSDEVTVTETP